jgi:hypothetical protein
MAKAKGVRVPPDKTVIIPVTIPPATPLVKALATLFQKLFQLRNNRNGLSLLVSPY